MVNPNFIKSHLKCTSLNPNNDSLLVQRLPRPTQNHYDIAILSRDPSNHNLWVSRNLNSMDWSIKFVGSINGLVCLYDSPCRTEFVRVWLWNPATKQCKEILPLRTNYSVLSVGFGYDPVANDFKCVCINSDFASRSLVTLECDVYSSKADSWNNGVALPNFEIRCSDLTIIVNGCPYWMYEKFSVFDNVLHFYTFEVGYDVFTLLPELSLAKYPKSSWRCVNLKDSLATMVWMEGLVDVYTLDESCGLWSKAYTVGLHTFEVMQCFKNGDIVFEDDEWNVFLYELKTNAIKSLGKGYSAGFNYTGSLVFVEGMKPLLDSQPCF